MLMKAREYLKQFFGYDSFRHGQEEIIQHVLAGRNTAGIMPTGGGKSLCYQIPALILPGITVVISPLISLMKDQVDALQQVGIPATFLNSSIASSEINKRLQAAADGHYKLLYIAPERLDSSFLNDYLQNLDVSLVAVDEAHCISQWGHDFRPSYLRIWSMIEKLRQRPVVLALTATATPQVRQDICQSLGIVEQHTVITGFERTNLSFKVVKGQNKDKFLIDYVQQNKNEAGIIYAATRRDVDELSSALVQKGIKAGRYHAGMNDSERAEQQEQFLQDELTVIVATNAFGMGIDKSNVRYVIHYQLPKSMESFYQEAGRAGRDGLPSECILLYSAHDVQIQRFLIDQSSSTAEHKSQELYKLQQMTAYSHTEGCLQSFILQYFGEDEAFPCGRCSNCTDNRTSIDVTKEAQMILSCMVRMGERFGKTMVSQVLTGSTNKKVMELGFNSLSTYGILKHQTAKDVTDFIEFLLSEQYIAASTGTYPVLRVTNKGKEVLRGNEKVMRKEQMTVEQIVQDDALFEHLRQLRKQVAGEENVPPFVIFSDQTLKDMCALLPQAEEEFLKVKGVGIQKQERYGRRFIDAIQTFCDENPDRIRKAEIKDTLKKEKKENSHLDTFELYRQGFTLEQISSDRNLSLATVENHLLRCTAEGMELRWEELIPSEYVPLIQQAIQSVGQERLKPIKEQLPDEVTYFMIKAIMLKNNLRTNN